MPMRTRTLDELRALHLLRSPAIVGSLNVFGRPLAKYGRDGRDHWGGRHVMLVARDPVRGGIVGGIEREAIVQAALAT